MRLMVLCRKCGNRFPNSVLLEKACKKEKETCENCNGNIFSYYNEKIEKIEFLEPINKEKHSDVKEEMVDMYSKSDRNYEERSVYGDENDRGYDYRMDTSFHDEEILRHERETQNYIINDFNNNGINDRFE